MPVRNPYPPEPKSFEGPSGDAHQAHMKAQQTGHPADHAEAAKHMHRMADLHEAESKRLSSSTRIKDPERRAGAARNSHLIAQDMRASARRHEEAAKGVAKSDTIDAANAALKKFRGEQK